MTYTHESGEAEEVEEVWGASGGAIEAELPCPVGEEELWGPLCHPEELYATYVLPLQLYMSCMACSSVKAGRTGLLLPLPVGWTLHA